MIKVTLEAARRNVKLTQKEVAEKLGISNSTICNWENGVSFPDAKQIEKLCELYGLSYDNINFLTNNPFKTD